MDFHKTIGYMLVVFVVNTASAPSERTRRQSPFSGMGAGPFHSPMGPMGGMGHMGPSMGGPSMGGQSRGSAGSMFTTSVGLGCVRHEIVCPHWCLAVDKNGCKSCPCGPAGGMNAVAGGPSGGPMGGVMSNGGAMGGTAMSGGPMGAMPIGSGPSGGFIGGGGVSDGGAVSGGSSGGGGGGVSTSGGGTITGGGGSITSHSSTTTYVAAKPLNECAATLLCTSTCEGYTLGSISASGCRSCSCPASHHVSTTTIKYIVQTVEPAKKECTVTSYCMRSCSGGYVMSQTDGYGCPECSCVKVDKPYVPPIEIAVEPPPDNYQYPIEYAVEPPPERTYSLTCAAHSCNSGCTVGYKCGRDGCPSCECIHPAAVGLTTVHQVYIEKPLRCRNSLACPSRCSLGYKCGTDGCPTCQCLTATTYVQTRPHYTAQTCTHTLTCAATCTNGYELFTDGTSSCTKCACKQQVVYETRPQYSVQRPGPQYQIVECPSTDTCSSQCPHGYSVIRTEGRCPKCQCKQAPVYYAVGTSNIGCDNCYESSYYTSGTTYSGSGGSVSYLVTSGGRTNSGSESSYLVSSGGSGMGSYRSVGPSYTGATGYGSTECQPLPPDCQPSCIVYDSPCRRCSCKATYVRYSNGK